MNIFFCLARKWTQNLCICFSLNNHKMLAIKKISFVCMLCAHEKKKWRTNKSVEEKGKITWPVVDRNWRQKLKTNSESFDEKWKWQLERDRERRRKGGRKRECGRNKLSKFSLSCSISLSLLFPVRFSNLIITHRIQKHYGHCSHNPQTHWSMIANTEYDRPCNIWRITFAPNRNINWLIRMNLIYLLSYIRWHIFDSFYMVGSIRLLCFCCRSLYSVLSSST